MNAPLIFKCLYYIRTVLAFVKALGSWADMMNVYSFLY